MNKSISPSLRLTGKVWGITIGISLCIAVLFYRSIYGLLLVPVFYKIVKKQMLARQEEVQKQSLLKQFMHGIYVLDTALQAGLSMENAWIEVEKEVKILYGEKALFYLYVKEINHFASLNRPLEGCISDFAYKTGIEEIIQFAEVFEYGKRSGGNWRKIIGNVVQRLQEKIEAKQQIELMVAEKKLEQQVMNVIPLGMLAFLQISSWDYVSVMYHNPFGIFCMTVILLTYGFSVYLSEKIMQIRV